ncbi:hypothetical protein DENSPDRAFT_911229 [Dentipellis sp. KUC8613]|nr:hypothetical protein DENSPDRAFT_911229 [Dentipellis sp. KUC8613]
MSKFTKLYAYASLLSLVGTQALAANDWDVPCTQGQCTYDLPANSGASATVQVTGSTTAISDITTAAGWEILECDADGLDQTIKMVCTSTTAACDHVLQNGAKDTLVRLPQNCGQMPFARVASMTETNQTIPSTAKRSLFGRGGTTQTVYTLDLDTNFAAANPSQHGAISFSVQGVNLPDSSTAPAKSRRFVSRPMKQINGEVKDKLEHKFNETRNIGPHPVDLNVDKTLINLGVTCPVVNGNVNVGINAKTHVDVSLGATAVGTVIPPKLDDFSLFVALDGNIDGTLTAKATAQGPFTSGAIPVFSAGIPGFNVPGIFSVGPAFTVNAEVTGDVELELDLTTGLAYSFSNVEFEFPPGKSASTGTFGPSDNTFTLSASPELSGSANITAHLIPELTVGIKVLNGVGTADVFLDLDASASLNITGVDLKASGTVGTAGKSGSAAAQACVDVSTGLNAHVGATAALLDVFDKTAQLTLFNKNFDLFQKCFAAKTAPPAAKVSPAVASQAPAAPPKAPVAAPPKAPAGAPPAQPKAPTAAPPNTPAPASPAAPKAPVAAPPKAPAAAPPKAPAAAPPKAPAAAPPKAPAAAPPKAPAAAPPKAPAAAPPKAPAAPPAAAAPKLAATPTTATSRAVNNNNPLAKRASLKCSTFSAPQTLVSQLVHAIQQKAKS